MLLCCQNRNETCLIVLTQDYGPLLPITNAFFILVMTLIMDLASHFLLLRCGEDERPLNELLILQLGAEHPNGRYNISMCKIFGSQCQEKRKFMQEADHIQVHRLQICYINSCDLTFSYMIHEVMLCDRKLRFWALT